MEKKSYLASKKKTEINSIWLKNRKNSIILARKQSDAEMRFSTRVKWLKQLQRINMGTRWK